MKTARSPLAPHPASFEILAANAVQEFARETSHRFQFRVPEHWRSPVFQSPFAQEAEREVLAWFAGLGCFPEELARARAFDIAGYVGIPFPALSARDTVRTARYLALWLLWDDVHVERLEKHWLLRADDVRSGRRPEGMSRFDEGWWALFQEFAARRSPRWVGDVCEAMATWNAAAVEEALLMRRYQEEGEAPSFERQLELRIATIGMYTTLLLLEDAYDAELPPDFHAHPTVRRLKLLANLLVGLGNDVLSFGKDFAEGQPSLVTTLMRESGLSGPDALERLIRMHDRAVEEYDGLAASLGSWGGEADTLIARWVQDVRQAALGFSLWEARAPRYTAHKVVAGGRVIEPTFHFMPSGA